MSRKPYPHFPFVDDYYREHIKLSIERLKTFEPADGYYLSFSGGKDSCVVYHLCKMANVKFNGHYSNTTIDHPELVEFIKHEYSDIKIHKPKSAFLKELAIRGFPLRQARWCCSVYKEGNGTGVVLTGIRWAESYNRKGRRMMEPCLKDSRKHYLHPIIDWDDKEVWYFINENHIPYCKLYDEGYKRLGCIFCPNLSATMKKKQYEQYPKFVNAFKISFRKLYADRKAKGLTSVDRWQSGDEMFEWWLYGDKR